MQLAAVRTAIDGVAHCVFEDHMDRCIVNAMETDQPNDQDRGTLRDICPPFDLGGSAKMISASVLVLLLAAASVALFHTILPDHWMPIVLVARVERWSSFRLIRVALWTGLAHVFGSLVLGAIVIGLGYSVKGTLQLEGPLVGIVLVVTGIAMFLWNLRQRGHGHPHSHADDDHPHTHESNRQLGRPTWLVSAGIAASPDLTILPIFLAAVAVSLSAAIEVFFLFALVTILSIILL